MICTLCKDKIRFWQRRENLPLCGEVHKLCLRTFNNEKFLSILEEKAEEIKNGQ